MSSRNPAAAKSTAIDNKKTDDVGDGFDFSKESVVVVASSDSNKESLQKKEYLLNIGIGDEEDQDQGVDSGFLSGPQNSFYEEQEQEQNKTSAAKENKKNNFDIGESLHNPNKIEDELYIIDSGCIEEDEEEQEDQYVVNDDDDDNSNGTDAKFERHSIAQQHQRSDTSSGALNITSSHNKNMKLKHNVDIHMSERFCNISLQDGSVNNLNAPGRAATSEAGHATQLPLREQYYQQNDDGDTYLHLACLSGHENVVAALIRLAIHPSFLNIKNDCGQTPLHLAALTKQANIARMLLLAGAEPTLRDCHGNTALHLACMSGDDLCVNALIMPFSPSEINEAQRQYNFKSNPKLSNNLEIRNYNGDFCVHIAAEAGYIKIMRLLAYYGADINAKEGKGGYTPLHIAIEKGNEELFKFLIDECKHKLNLETLTFGRLTAYQFACLMKKSRMQSVLQNRGAEPLTPPDSEYESSEDEFE